MEHGAGFAATVEQVEELEKHERVERHRRRNGGGPHGGFGAWGEGEHGDGSSPRAIVGGAFDEHVDHVATVDGDHWVGGDHELGGRVERQLGTTRVVGAQSGDVDASFGGEYHQCAFCRLADERQESVSGLMVASLHNAIAINAASRATVSSPATGSICPLGA